MSNDGSSRRQPVTTQRESAVARSREPSSPTRSSRSAVNIDDLAEPRRPAVRNTLPDRVPSSHITATGRRPSRPAHDEREDDEPAPAQLAPVTESAIRLRYARSLVEDPWYDDDDDWVRRPPLALLAVVSVVSLIIIALWLNPGIKLTSPFGQALPPAVASRSAPAAPPGEHSILGDPTIDAAQVEAVLAKYGSPAGGSGQTWIDLGRKYGIDPAYALAFFIHESTAGTASGWAGLKPDGSTTHNIGNIICAGYATCYGRFRDYPSWAAGIEDWYRLIAVEYVEGRGVTTVEEILPIYAPAVENDVPRYVGTVEGLVEDWRQGIVR